MDRKSLENFFELIAKDSESFAISILWAAMILLLGVLSVKVIIHLLSSILDKARLDTMIRNFLLSIAKAAMLLLIFIAVLKKLGFDTNSLVALIGAAGLAIGLALQSSLTNFASGFLLILFKPMKTGDYVEIAGVKGYIEKINIFSTTILSDDNKEITVSNGTIYNGIIVNHSRRESRRIDLIIGISYSSNIKKAKDLLQMITDEDPRILKNPATVIAVAELTDKSVSLIVRPWVKTPDYWTVRFDLIEKIKITFDANDIIIPVPLHLNVNKIG